MIKVKKFPATIYPVGIWVAIADDWEEVNKKFGTRKDENDKTCATVLEYDDNRFVIVFIKDKFKLQYITHEVVHTVNLTFKYAGVKPDVDNDETQAYFTSELFRMCYEFLTKHLSQEELTKT